ncbi:retrovirus-related pol polyprotein from transposon TNT 1-94 [Tanacetum coccineum]
MLQIATGVKDSIRNLDLLLDEILLLQTCLVFNTSPYSVQVSPYRIVEAPQSIRSKLFPSGYRSRGIPNNVIKRMRVGPFPDMFMRFIENWLSFLGIMISPDDEASEVGSRANTLTNGSGSAAQTD